MLSPTAPAASVIEHSMPCPGCQGSALVRVCFDADEPCSVRVVCSAGCPNTDALIVAAVDVLYPLPITA